MKVIILAALTVACLAEPPVDNRYLPPVAPGSQGPPSTLYGTPVRQTDALFSRRPSNEYGPPSTQYGVPGQGVDAPSSSYGAPGFGGQQSRQYLPPGGGRGGYGDEGNSEPANYNFEYMVKDEPSGNDFGHRESRMGDRAEGVYYVLLPDGRKQTVKYEADQNGYKPQISYEDTGRRQNGGYNRNAQSGYDSNAQNFGGPY